MPGMTANEAWEKFQAGGGEYGGGWNNPSHFANETEWANFKEMVPKEAKQAFRQKVAGNENRAIEGLQQGLTREQMGIFNKKDQGQALYRRLGAGLGSGLDMNKAYDWGGGQATEVGTSDLNKRGIERRGITGTERQRYADFSAAGSPESYWQQHRGNQISGLLASGAIAQDANGYYNPGPGGGDRYGANLEGYNLGQNPMGAGRGDPRNVGYTPQTVQPGWYGQGGGGSQSAQPAYTSPYNTPTTGGAAPQPWTPPSGSPMAGGGPSLPPNMQSFGGGATPGGSSPMAPPSFAAQVSGGSPGTPRPLSYGAPTGTPPQTGGGFRAPAGAGAPAGGGVIYERPPGQVGPFGAPGTGNPSGNANFPAVPMPGQPGGPTDPAGAGGAGSGGGGVTPALPGIDVTPGGLPPGMDPFGGYMNTSYGNQLNNMGAGDQRIQDFNLMRALAEYQKSQGYEGALGQHFGDILGYDLSTGQPLQGQAADTANARSFGAMAPQVSRIMGDTDALGARLRREVPEGGEKNKALGDLYSEAAGNIGGLRQDMYGQALSGLGDLAMAAKSFDPGAYTGGAQSLLSAYGQGRGQDIDAYGQSLQALLGQRGQDSQWGLGWGQMNQQGANNAWQNYLTARGQDMDLFSGTRGQDLQRLLAQQQAQNDRRGQNAGLIGGLAGAAGTVIAAL
jgi:hypothetical protein